MWRYLKLIKEVIQSFFEDWFKYKKLGNIKIWMMDSVSNIAKEVEVSRFNLSDEPSFQHKRRTSLSPSKRYAREPNLPIRKKVPRQYSDDGGDFFILGDQSKFRLDMIPYRARSLSAHRYSDSADMLRWIDGNDSNSFYCQSSQHYSRGAHEEDGRTSDNHYHSCSGEPSGVQHLHGNNSADRINDLENNKNIPGNSKARTQSPKRVQLDLEDDNREFQRKTNPSHESSAKENIRHTIIDNRNKRKNVAPSSYRQVAEQGGGASARKEKISKKLRNHKKFLTKGDVGKFLNDKDKGARQNIRISKSFSQNKQNNIYDLEMAGLSNSRSKLRSETKIANNSTNSNESLGDVIASRSNMENIRNNVVSEEINFNTNAHHHLNKSIMSEYQDKFQWKGKVLFPSYSPLGNTPKFTSLNNETFKPARQTEYANQFWPKSTEPLQKFYHNHNHNIIRDEYYEEANVDDAEKDQVMLRENNLPTVRNNDQVQDIHRGYEKGVDANDSHSHSHHYKSEYARKFKPPSDYLLIDGTWIKNAHIWRILGNSQNSAKENFDGIGSTPYQQDIHLGDSWFDYILELRRMADEYRCRDFGINFSRDHLAQVKFNKLNFWDASSTNSFITPKEEKILLKRGINSMQKGMMHLLPGNKENMAENIELAVNNNNIFDGKEGRSNHYNLIGHQSRSEGNFKSSHARKTGIESARIGHGDQDTSELSESLSSSLSLAEEVLERAQRRKINLWTTK